MEENRVCCICGCVIEGYGNNAEGADREFLPGLLHICCDSCNLRYVIPGRMRRLWDVRQEVYGTNKKEEK